MNRKPDAENAYQRAVLGAYTETVRKQREWARVLATKIEAGEALESFDGMFVAAIVRSWADTLNDQPPRKRGKQAEFNHHAAAMTFAHLTKDNRMSKFEARAKLAEKHGVSVEAIKRAIKPYQDSPWVRLIQLARKKQIDGLGS